MIVYTVGGLVDEVFILVWYCFCSFATAKKCAPYWALNRIDGMFRFVEQVDDSGDRLPPSTRGSPKNLVLRPSRTS